MQTWVWGFISIVTHKKFVLKVFLPSGHLQWILTHFSWIHYPLLQQPLLQLFLQEGAFRASHSFELLLSIESLLS